ncbi:MAG: helix-turn-helix domain-containing protein [Rhizobiaceae bacterium]|nr:helix-turn-helix domain-containing protein [Rhizobiaceae bacterium]
MSSLPKDAEVRRIGRQIRLLRERAGQSIAQLSRGAGLSERAVRDLEAGRTNPSLATVVAVVDVLGASLDELIAAARETGIVSNYTQAIGTSETSVDLTRSLPEPRMRARIIVLDGEGCVDLPTTAVFGHVLGDNVVVSLDGEETVLRRGDSFHAGAGVLAGWRGQSSSSRLLVVETADDNGVHTKLQGR